MKNLFLTAAVLSVVSLSSCKSEKEKVADKVENAQENVTQTITDQVEAGKETMNQVADATKNLPTFSDSKLTEFVSKYNQWALDLKEAATKGDAPKLAELTKQSVDFEKELQALSQSLTPEDAKKLQDWTGEIKKQLNN